MKRKKLHIIPLCLAFLMLCGCTNNKLPLGAAENEILTMIPVQQDKKLVTVRYEYGSADCVDIEGMIEKAFPDVDIVMCHDGTGDAGFSLRHDLISGTEKDIIITAHAPDIADIAPQYLLNLAAEEFTGNYIMTSLDACVCSDGNLYYLPAPSDVYGVIYNRTMFEENGWEIPHSYSEFVQLIDTINSSGLTAEEKENDVEQTVNVKAIQATLKWPDAFQIVFNTFAYDKVYHSMDNQKWLTDYQNGSGTMVGRMEPAAETLKQLFSDGILSIDDMNIKPGYRSSKMYRYHSAAMIIENLNAVKYNEDFAYEDDMDEIGIFPFYTSDKPDSDYLYSIPSYYYAINKSAAEESGEKKQLLIDIMAFLSSPEAQREMIGDSLQISNVSGVTTENTDFIKDIQETIDEGRVIGTFSFAGKSSGSAVEQAMLNTLPDLISGSMTTEEWLKNADAARDKWLAPAEKPEVYGQAARTFTKLETALIVGDMYRHETGADIALVLAGQNSYGVNGYIYGGDITDKSISCISEAKMYDEGTGIAVCSMTGQQITDFLSGSCTVGSRPEEHYIASGLEVEFAPWREKGSRLISCRLPDGRSIDPEETYTVAYCKYSLKDTSGGTTFAPDGEIILDGTWEEHFIGYIKSCGGIIDGVEQTTHLIWDA